LELDLRRQLRDDRLHAIVDIDRVDVGIGAEFETYGESVRAVIAARALHVDHLVDADDLGLQRLGHRGLEHLRGGARIPRGDLDLGRHDIGELRDGIRVRARSPPSVMTIAMTIASRGRSMNTGEIMGISSGWRGTIRVRVSPAHWGVPAGLPRR
jgi:hypothetical protein